MALAVRDVAEGLATEATRDVWGVLVSYMPRGGSAVPIRAEFNSDHEYSVEEDGLIVTDRAPTLLPLLSDLVVEPRAGDVYEVQDGPHLGETYTVVDARLMQDQTAELISVRGVHA
ncbi:MAG: hypothetical protein PVJ64_00245 [Gemmatimonadales bacterium]